MKLTPQERRALDRLVFLDMMPEADYRLARGEHSGHAFADNQVSMVFDLTIMESVDADTIAEADRMVAGHDPA